MHGLDFTPRTAAPLALALVAMLATAGRLVSALNDRRYLKAAMARGRVLNAEVTQRLVRSGVRREAVRMFKHLVGIAALVVSYTVGPHVAVDSPIGRVIESRNWFVGIIALCLMLNSVLDYFAQRWAMRFFHHGHYAPLPPSATTPQAEVTK